jgi:membrane protein implicated in regulation of membrane protease activity
VTGLSPHSIWFIAGAALVAIEIFLVPGTGFFFPGLGAITVGAVLIAGWVEGTNNQFIMFFLSTTVWAALLWKPLKRVMRSGNSGYSDMVGDTAVVYGEPLKKGKKGQVKWSGTIMNCEIASQENTETILPGTDVTITEVSKGILIVKQIP